MSRSRRIISLSTSTLTRTQRILIITLASLLVLGGVAVSQSAALRERLGFSARSKPAPTQQTQSRTAARKNVDLLRMAGVKRTPGERFSLFDPLAPTVSATKTDALFTDVDNDTQADPGDTIKYTVTINSSGEDATGVTFTDTVDPNTNFVPGSLMVTPVAVDDSYSALGNVRISVPAPGVRGNDFDGVPSATASAPATSTNGGNVAMNADGSFTYNPPAGFEGSDTFTYTLTNAAGSNPGTVTITVSGMIWFINDNPGACVSGCDGRLTTPFTTLAAFAAVNNGAGNNPAANDNIFLYESAVDYVGPVTLLNGQRFIGQDATASLSAITGLTPPTFSDPLPAMNSGNAIIVNITSAGNSINVASGNTLRGFTGGNSLSDISGTSFGTLTIADVTLNGTGQALNLTTGTLAATFNSISSTGSTTTGISLTSVAGSLTNPSTTITNPVGIGLSVNTSSATLNFGNTSSTLSGGTGVSLTTNTGAITFGALNITPDPGQRGLLATDNSSTITSTSGAITTSGATAVEITRGVGTTPLVISQTSVSATGGSNGIRLSNTSGSFTVAGSGGTCTFLIPTCSGGRITTTTGADNTTAGIGVSLNNVSNITLTSMRIDNHPNFAIRGHGVVGFTLQSSVVDGNNGTSATADLDLVDGEDSIRIINLTGSALIDDCFIGGGYEQNLRVVNALGTLNRLTVSDTSIGDLDGAGPGRGVDNTNGANDVYIESRTSGTVMNTTFTNDILNNGLSNVIFTNATLGTNMDVVFRNNAVSNNHPNIAGGGGGALFAGIGAVTYDISCNSFRDSNGIALNLFKGRPTNGTTGGTWSGTIFNNTIGVTGIAGSGTGPGASGINVDAQGNGTHTTLIKNNVVRNYGESGIKVNVVDANISAPVAVTLNATVIGNVTAEPDPINAFAGFFATQGAVPGADVNTTLNLKLGGAGAEQNNFTDGDPNDFNDVFMFQGAAPDGQFNLTRGNSVSSDPTTVVMDNNVSPITVFADIGIVVVASAPALPAAINESCAPPAFMLTDSSESLVMGDSGITTFDEPAEFDNTLRTTDGENVEAPSVHKLTTVELQLLAQEGIRRWADAGASAGDIARMQAVLLQVSDLPAGQLATANTTQITLDETAAGYGWYFDATPSDDSEFDVPVPNREIQTSESGLAHGRVDLLTVVMRQLGTLRTTQRSGLKGALRSLMQNTLGTGIRRLPVLKAGTLKQPLLSKSQGNRSADALAQSVGQKVKSSKKTIQKPARRSAHHAIGLRSMVNNARPTVSSMLSDINLSIGTLPAGESVVITFNVTVDDPFTGALPQVSNQGTVSGTNFADVLTDDPTVGGAADPTVTPIDLPQVTLAVSPASVLEDGATNLVYTFTRTGSTVNAMTVNFSVGGSASFTEPDYTQTGAATFTASSGTVVIPGGSSTATVTINPSADTTVEPDETVDLTVTAGTGYTVGSPSLASGTITNDDTDVSLAVSPASVAEDGATNLVYTFTRGGVTTNSLTVNFSVGGTADFGASPNDYTQTGATTFTSTTGSVTFTSGSSTATVTVNPEADSTVESDETVILTLTSGAGYNVGSPSSATGTITNDDANVSVTVSPSSVTEDGATNLVYTFVRNGFTGGALTVNFTVGGTADFGVSPNDYTQTGATTFTPTTGSVTFGAGSSMATVTVNPEADATAESDETVIITLAAGAGYNVVSPSSATGTIVNDDTIVTVAVSPSSTAEGGANLVYTFTRTGSTVSAVTVNFSVGGSASFPADYSQSGAATFTPPTATVNFGAGNSTATVTVTPLTDCTVEGSETVEFTVQPGAGYGVGSPSMATGTITNTADSTAPTITLIPNVNITYWPPDHDYESIAVTDFVASASDDCDPTVNINSVYILKISSDEAEDGAADGSTLNDIVIGASCKTAQLRAERSGSGDGRVYTITFKVKDSSGNFTTATATVTVRVTPGNPAVDSGPVYTVNSICP